MLLLFTRNSHSQFDTDSDTDTANAHIDAHKWRRF